jgi:hypothetical protein
VRYVAKRGVTIRIERPKRVKHVPLYLWVWRVLFPVKEHVSETALDDWHFDYIIKNDGTLAELRTKVLAVYRSIKENQCTNTRH